MLMGLGLLPLMRRPLARRQQRHRRQVGGKEKGKGKGRREDRSVSPVILGAGVLWLERLDGSGGMGRV
jgi:hypothetical protein